MWALDWQTADEELARFQAEYKDKYPKVVVCLTKGKDTLFTFMHYPASHWIHSPTTNPIESGFSIVKARTRTIKGAGSRGAGLTKHFRLITMAERQWRKINSPHLALLVQIGAKFPDGRHPKHGDPQHLTISLL